MEHTHTAEKGGMKMREFLFRAYDKGRKEFLSGGNLFITINTSRYPNKSEIYLDEISNADKYKERFVVEQYTGLTDKNGKKIFEGDIVTVYARGYHTICTVSWAETVAHFQLWQINTIPKTSTNLNLGNYDCEVIGNIHDNPELIDGERIDKK